MGQPTTNEWNVAEKLYGLTRDKVLEKVLHKVNSKFLSGYDRHSYGLIMSSPEIIEKHGLLGFDEYPGANIIDSNGIPLNHPLIKNYLREIRTREGVTLISMRADGPVIIKNGLKLPQPLMSDVLNSFGAVSADALTEYLNLGEELGSKTLAFLSLSREVPELSMLKLDETKYLVKGGTKHNFSLKHKFAGELSQLQI